MFSFPFPLKSIIFGFMDILRQVKKTILKNDLLSERDSVLVAFSGGPDSVALLHVLSRLRRSMKLSLTAIYINHQIRKKAAAREEQFCQQLCDDLEVDLDIVSEDIPALAKKWKKGIEETAREFRYDVFDLLATEDGHDRIALGHHADDRVETILFRIIRGTGMSGLTGIPIKRGRIIRPLFHLTKAAILEYLKDKKLGFCTDQSNSGVEYKRNYIRNKLLVSIRKDLNPQVDRSLLNLSENIAVDEAYLEQIAGKAVKKSMKLTPGGKIELDLGLLTGYDASVRRRVLRCCMKTLSIGGLAPDKVVIDRLDGLVRRIGAGVRERTSVSLPGRCQAKVAGESMFVYRREALSYRQRLDMDGSTRLKRPAMDFHCRTSIRTAGAPIEKKRGSRKVTLDRNKLKPPLFVRNIKAGDRFTPLGLRGSKKAGDFLTDRKVPVPYRDEIPVVCDGEGIVWLVGFEIADRVKVKEKTGKVVTIEVSVRKSRTAPAV